MPLRLCSAFEFYVENIWKSVHSLFSEDKTTIFLFIYAYSVTVSKQIIAQLSFFRQLLLLEDFYNKEQLQLDGYLLTDVRSFQVEGFYSFT